MSHSIEQLAEEAFLSGSTDLFLCADCVPRVRVNGRINVLGAEVTSGEAMAEFWKACGAEPDEASETDCSMVIGGGKRLRVNLYLSLGNLAAVLRPIKEEIPSLEELGAPVDLLTSWAKRHSGLILVTGATGSGKSTTLAAMLQWINEYESKHIITIEDPIEYLFSNHQSYFSQRELGSDTTSFSAALRAALRQSPDIILVGEIRDFETAQICLQAAETGHLVLATLHSSGVTDTLQRITNLMPIDQRDSLLDLLSYQLIGVISQKLLPGKEAGMVLAVEHLQNAAATRAWIREGNKAEIADHINRGDDPNNCSYVRYLAAAAQQGFMTQETARQAAPNAQDF
ncbi:MAG: type IV pilus twitching motility protein PilT, partial [Akkermansiaceae bacterium]